MTRLLFLAAFAASAAAMPPVPRVVLPESVVNPPKPGDAEKSDPAALAEQIAKDAKGLGEKLASKDTGPETLTGQEKLKKDIEKLIESLENPPPMGGGGGGGGSPPPPMGGGGGGGGGGSPPPPPGGGGSSGSSGGSSGKPSGGRAERKEKRGTGQKPEQSGGGQPMPMGSEPAGGNKPGDKEPAGGKPGEPKGNGQPGGGGTSKPALPLDEAIARDFWGNLPDLPRQRMMQFFREQYLSRYKDLLPQYYQSLSEKDKKGKK